MNKFHDNNVTRLTPRDAHYFFGYFDKFPWDSKDERLLAHRVGFVARQPFFGEKAAIGVVEDGKFHPVAETSAWCWQQGSMLQWFSDDEIIYNDLEEDHHVARILNLNTGKSRTVCRPISCLSNDRRYALSINFSRLDRERPGYGYPGLTDPTIEYGYPDFDGIHLIDLKENTSKVIISLYDIVSRFPRPGMDQTANWFSNPLFAPDGRHFVFVHRWRTYLPEFHGTRNYVTRMFTSDLSGKNLWELPMEGHSSHFTWFSPEKMIVFSRTAGDGNQYHIYTNHSEQVETIAKGLLPNDGHCSFSSDAKWLLTDSYPEADRTRRLCLYHPESDTVYQLGSFLTNPDWPPPTRCDLHPRWSRNMKKICFDSIHEGMRGIYAVNIEEIIGKC